MNVVRESVSSLLASRAQLHAQRGCRNGRHIWPLATGLLPRFRQSGLSIYDALEGQPGLIYPTIVLETRLREMLTGLRWDAPQRTRSKLAKTVVAEALGYVAPRSFTRLLGRPRFPGQDMDVYVQMSNNLQVWNQEVSPTRRYVLIRVDANNIVTTVRVLTGVEVALLDRTGTLTSKYQAKRRSTRTGALLVPATTRLAWWVCSAPFRIRH